jgi:cbb3-type cytochrome oxidase cytochrome c subunit
VNQGPLIFLGVFFALAASWFGMVLTPSIQLGHMMQTNTVPAGAKYPLARPGFAAAGADVYRANGCAYCHSEQVLQQSTVCDVLLSEPGTNQNTVVAALKSLRPDLTDASALELMSKAFAPVLRGVKRDQANDAAKTLTESGAIPIIWIVPVGGDIAQNLGLRQSVAEDYLYDYPVMLGAQRFGPDLADVGNRKPDARWHLEHLYDPRSVVQNSPMPSYRFLFEKRKIIHAPSAEALQLKGNLAPEAGYEIVPRPEAKALVAYLTSLRAEEPLFVAPRSVSAAPTSSGTNAAAGGTNAPAGNTNAPATTNATPTGRSNSSTNNKAK